MPIVPMTVIGSRKILSKYGMRVNPGTITLIIDKPIYPDSHDVISLMENVFNSIKSNYGHQDGHQFSYKESMNQPLSIAH